MPKTREEIIEYVDDCDLEYVLDDMVHIEASKINNKNVQEQVDFLLEQGVSLQEIEKALDKETDSWKDEMPEPVEGLEPPKDDGSGSVRA